MSKNEIMRQQIAAIFPEKNLAGCFSTQTQPAFCVVENKTDSAVSLLTLSDPALAAQKYLKVSNPHQKEISLLAIDGCMMSPQDPARCDALLFDDRRLSFTELKLDMPSRRNRSVALKKAIEQLEATLALFDDRMARHEKDWLALRKKRSSWQGCREVRKRWRESKMMPFGFYGNIRQGWTSSSTKKARMAPSKMNG